MYYISTGIKQDVQGYKVSHFYSMLNKLSFVDISTLF